jgi:hypothetical protein
MLAHRLEDAAVIGHQHEAFPGLQFTRGFDCGKQGHRAEITEAIEDNHVLDSLPSCGIQGILLM